MYFINNILDKLVNSRLGMFIPFIFVVTFILVGYVGIDKQPPIINSDSITINYGKRISKDDLDIKDNRDSFDDLEVIINDNTVNTNQLGSYKMTVIVKDSLDNETIKRISVNVVDDMSPVFKVNNNEGYIIKVDIGSSNDITNYIQASDNVDGDVTPFMECSNSLDTSTISRQSIEVSVKDTSGNQSKETFIFAIDDYTSPKIELLQGKDVVLDYGKQFNIDEYIRVSDNLDSNVEVKLNKDINNTLENKTQVLRVSCNDYRGNYSNVTLKVMVKDISAPSIRLKTNSLNIEKGESLNPLEYIEEVVDNKDGNLINHISFNQINTSVTGKQEIIYKVSDSSANEATAILNVYVNSKNEQLLSYAYSKLGCPYVWGAVGPDCFDCSGLTTWVYKQEGINIPRTAQQQSLQGEYISYDNLLPGDLVFFGSGVNSVSHVGIYIGEGKMIHSPHSGDVVKIANLNKNYVVARRYL